MALTRLQFYNSQSDELDVLLHGFSKGMDSEFMEKLFSAAKESGRSIVSFDFPYFVRGDEQSSGSELIEEQECLRDVINSLEAFKFRKIRLVGKSFGGIVASHFLQNYAYFKSIQYSLVILGFVNGDEGVKLESFPGEVVVIQGELDRHGDTSDVKEQLQDKEFKSLKVIGIEGADHSYRNEDGEPEFEDEVAELVYST